nr:DUF2510 domain-containing protein [Streptomyces sp. NBC_00857]
MSMTTPPGWYPDPAVPSTERWWDGTSWTGHTRPPAGAVMPPAVTPVPAGAGTGGSGGGGGRGGLMAVLAAGVALVVAIAVGAILLGDDDPETGPRATDSGTPLPPTTNKNSEPPSPTPGDASSEDPTVLVDQLNSITLPIPDGWERPESALGDAVTMSTVDTYDCPGDSGRFCPWGTVTSRTATGTDVTSPEKLAKEDISRAADATYEEDGVGARLYGGIVSHKQIASRPTVVAGRTGYLVRWEVTTEFGPGGRVQSLVFPSTAGTGTPVIVRTAFDKGPKALPISLMDTITEGIRPLGDVSGGVGSSLGP